MIDLSIRKSLGDFCLTVEQGSSARSLGILGPSGSGKTTLLQCIAGLLPLDAGRILVETALLTDTARGVQMPTPRRGIGMVFQDALLFPHRSVRANLLYGANAHGPGPAFDDVVGVLELGSLLDRRPGTLSGGQARCVAIGRALLSGPRLLLLDEPLAGLDRELALRTLHFLKRIGHEFGVPFLYVSHTVSDIIYLCEEAWSVRDGRVIAAGAPRTLILQTPSDRVFPADLATYVLARRESGESAVYRVGGLQLHCAADNVRPGQESLIAIRADDVILAAEQPPGLSARNVIAATVTDLASDGSQGWVLLTVDAACPPWLVRLTRLAMEELRIKPGSRLFAIVKATSLRAVPVEG